MTRDEMEHWQKLRVACLEIIQGVRKLREHAVKDEDIVAAAYPGRRAPIIPTVTVGDEQLLFIEPARSAQPT